MAIRIFSPAILGPRLCGVVLEQVQHDVKSALKAGEKGASTRSRLIANELARREGGRRRRRRRASARAQAAARGGRGAYRDGGRNDRAAAEEREAEIITSYLPEQISDDELGAIVGDAVAESGASSPKEMGKVMALK